MSKKFTNTKKQLRNFWFLFSVIFFALFMYSFFSWEINIYFWFIFIAFLFLSLINPLFLSPLYFLWMKLWEILGFISSKIILFFIFFWIFSPIWLFFRTIWRDFLKKKLEKTKKSYWENSEQVKSMNKQF